MKFENFEIEGEDFYKLLDDSDVLLDEENLCVESIEIITLEKYKDIIDNFFTSEVISKTIKYDQLEVFNIDKYGMEDMIEMYYLFSEFAVNFQNNIEDDVMDYIYDNYMGGKQLSRHIATLIWTLFFAEFSNLFLTSYFIDKDLRIQEHYEGLKEWVHYCDDTNKVML